MYYWGDRGHCPKCGRFVGNILGTTNDLNGLVRVEGNCKKHGTVDITDQEWSCEEFEEYRKEGLIRCQSKTKSQK